MSRIFLGLAAIAAITLAPQIKADTHKYYFTSPQAFEACNAKAAAFGIGSCGDGTPAYRPTNWWYDRNTSLCPDAHGATQGRREQMILTNPVTLEKVGFHWCVEVPEIACSHNGFPYVHPDTGQCLTAPYVASACENPTDVEYISTGNCFPEEVDGPSALVICVKENDAPIQDHHLSVGDAGRVTSGSVQARVYVPGNVGASIEMTPEADSIANRPDCFSVPGIPGLTVADGDASVGWTAVIRNFLITDGLGPQSIELSVNSLEYKHLGIQFGFQGSDGEYFHYGEIPLIEGDTVSFPDGPEASVIKFHDVLRDDVGSPVGTIKNYQIRIQPIIP